MNLYIKIFRFCKHKKYIFLSVCNQKYFSMTDELNIARQKMQEIKEDEDIDEETKESLLTHSRFVACMLEKKDWVTIPHAISIII